MLNNRAITWLTTSNAGSVRFEQSVGHQRGYINHLEVTVIQSCLQRLNQEISAQGEKYSIGIITPYRAQLELIRNRLKQIPLSHIEVDINTVDAFQGSQRDIIIYSTVRSSNQRRIGFLKEEARLNVAFSRAKRALIIVGDGKFLRNPRIPGNPLSLCDQLYAGASRILSGNRYKGVYKCCLNGKKMLINTFSAAFRL